MIWTGFDRQFNRLNRNQLNRRSRQCRTKSNSHLFRWLKTRNAPKLYLKQQYLKKQLINKYLHFIQCLQIMDYNFVHQIYEVKSLFFQVNVRTNVMSLTVVGLLSSCQICNNICETTSPNLRGWRIVPSTVQYVEKVLPPNPLWGPIIVK